MRVTDSLEIPMLFWAVCSSSVSFQSLSGRNFTPIPCELDQTIAEGYWGTYL